MEEKLRESVFWVERQVAGLDVSRGNSHYLCRFMWKVTRKIFKQPSWDPITPHRVRGDELFDRCHVPLWVSLHDPMRMYTSIVFDSREI